MAEGGEQDNAQKTEEPTAKRREDALKKGQVVTSREVNHFFILLCLAALVIIMAPGLMESLKFRLSPYILLAHDVSIDDRSFLQNMRALMTDLLLEMLIFVMMCVAAVFAANAVQNRFVLSLEPIKPKLEKISPIKGVGRLFSRRNLVEFLKGILKIVIVGAIVVIAVYPYKEYLQLLPDESIFDILAFISTISARILIAVCVITALIALIDFAYQKYEHTQQLRMTKQEVRDEYKQQEGDPMVKQRLRQIRRERLSKQMMAAVPEADVVITNPTHYAVALKYDTATMIAPKLIAKGKDKVALRIKERAEEHKIIVMRNPPLTRLLFDNVAIDDEIPLEYYKAVAEIIGYVYKLKGIDLSKPN